MADVTSPDSQTQTVLQFKARVENGVIIPEEAITVPTGQVYLVTLVTVGGAIADPAAASEPDVRR